MIALAFLHHLLIRHLYLGLHPLHLGKIRTVLIDRVGVLD